MTILNELNKKISNLEKNIQDETIQLKNYQTDLTILQGNLTEKIDELNQSLDQKDIPFRVIYDEKLRFIKLINNYDSFKSSTKMNPRTISSIHICSGQVDNWIDHQFQMIEFYKVITKMFSLLPENVKFGNTNNNFWNYKLSKDNFVFEFYLNSDGSIINNVFIDHIVNDSTYVYDLPVNEDKSQMLTFVAGPYDYDLCRTASVPATAFHAILRTKLDNVKLEDLESTTCTAVSKSTIKLRELRN